MHKRMLTFLTIILSALLICSFVCFAEPGDEVITTENPEVTEQPTQEPPVPQTEPVETQPPAPVETRPAAQPRSNDSSLSALSVIGKTEDGRDYPVNLEPAFNPSTRTYNITVPFEVVRLDIRAAANHRAARISIPAGYLTLDVGQNRSFVNVTAEDGSTRRYQINTVRQEEVITEPTTEETTTEVTTQPETTTQPVSEEVIATAQPNIQKPPMNKFTKLGIVFACCGVLLFIIAVAMLSRKKDVDTED